MRVWIGAHNLLMAAAVFAATVTPAHAQPAGKRVLMIHGGPENFPGVERFDTVIRQHLFARPALHVQAFSEFLETEEFPETAETSLREYIRTKFHGEHIDLVIANTAPALQFALRYRDELFANAPIVFAANTPPAALVRGEVSGVTGVLRNSLQIETVELALSLHPRVTRVHVVAYAPEVDGYLERVQTALAKFSQRVTLTYETAPTLESAIANIRKLPANSLLYYARYTPASPGRVLFLDELLPPFIDASPVPVYVSGVDWNIGKGVVGGVARRDDSAQRLAEIAIHILEGAKPESIPIQFQEATAILDWRQIKRWRVDPSLLPPDADIRFREPTIWELYGPYLVATGVVVIAQLLLIAGLLQQRTRLRSADNTIRAREASLRTSYERIRNMAGRLINAQETARADIARDLHDDVSQKLAYVSIGVNSLRAATGDIQDKQTQQMFDELERETRNTFEGIRRLSHDLHPATLRLLGLAPALRSHCNEVAKRQAVEVQFSSSENVDTVHPDVAVCFFRIAQESLRNGITHGGAKHLTVSLQRAADRLELTVVDDGHGFDVSEAQSGGGLGLVTMEERINLVGGDVSVTSAVGSGTTVRVRGPANPTQLLSQP